MKKTIWKFQLEATDRQSVSMPFDAEILCVQVQDDIPCLWAIVNPDSPSIVRVFDTFGTGHNIDKPLAKRNYVGTYQLKGGALVFHLFELL